MSLQLVARGLVSDIVKTKREEFSLRAQLFDAAKVRFRKLCETGFWFCEICEGIDTRIDGEHGQPDHCRVCRSTKLKHYPPVSLTASTLP